MLVAAACSGEEPLADDLGADGAVVAEADTITDPTTAASTTTTAVTTVAVEEAEAEATTAQTTPPELIGDGLVALAQQPPGVPFPTDDWPEAELADRLDPDGVDAVREVVDGAFDESGRTYGAIEAIVVVSNGEIVVEEYGRGFTAEATHDSWSVAKSVTHAMLGILTAEDRIDMLARAPVQEWAATDDPRQEITPDMLARMSSGLVWNEVFDAINLVSQAPEAEVSSIAALRNLSTEPDTAFNYSTGSTAINARIIGDVVGTHDDFRAWADAELFAPIGIRSVELELDAGGYFVGGFGANMTARDFARFGLLYARDGVWDGERILPEGWVDYARTPSSTSKGYGSGFWLADENFAAAGFLGQRVAIVPEHDLVIVVLANNLNDGPIQQLLDDVGEPFADS